MADVISGCVLTVVRELEAHAALARQAVGPITAGKCPGRDDPEMFQLLEEAGDIKCMEKGAIESIFTPLGVVVDLTDEMTTSLGKIEPTMELAVIFLILAFLCWVAENLLAYKITKRK